jgi:hypothetical protein
MQVKVNATLGIFVRVVLCDQHLLPSCLPPMIAVKIANLVVADLTQSHVIG